MKDMVVFFMSICVLLLAGNALRRGEYNEVSL